MQIIKPAALIAAVLFMLSCEQKSGKPAVQEPDTVEGKEYKSNTTSAEEANGTPGLAGATNGATGNTDNNTRFFSANTKEKKDEEQKQKPGQTNDRKQQPPIVAKVATPDWEKKIIKTASVNIEVEDYNKYYASIREKVKGMGGYIAQEEQSQSDYKIENSMLIKVPVDQFDNAVAVLSGNVKKINERKISSEDVTAEVVDTKSRIEAKKQVRQRYMDLLGQARNMEEILNVQSEINGIQEEIESATGRIEYLGHSSSFSTISLTYYQVLNVLAKEEQKQQDPSFGEKVKNALGTGWEIVSSLFIGILTLWPLILASFFAWLLYKRLRVQKPKQA
jgi:hypothetical protein